MDHDDHQRGSDEVPHVQATSGGADEHGDPLLAVRAELETVEELSLEQRAAVFQRTHEVVVEELRALELG